MSGLFGTLSSANKGLMASQTALQTTSHNVTNSNTRGYTRQRVNFQADKAFNHVGVGQIGTGVRMASIIRTSNEFVNRQVWNETSSLERYGVKSDIMGQLEGIFNEPSSTGVNNDLNQVFDAWSKLASDPGNSTAKTVVAEKMKALTDNINHMYGQMSDLKAETERELKQGVKDFNGIIENLDKLNEQIFYVSIRGQTPNDLLDQRDVLIEDLNKNISVDVKFDDYGRTQISLKGNDKNTILDHTKQVGKLHVSFEEDNPKVGLYKAANIENGEPLEGFTPIVGDLNKEKAIQSGSFKGNYEGVKEVEKKIEELRKFAAGITQSFNAVHGKIDENSNRVIEDLFTASEDLKNGKIIEFNQEIYDDPSKIVSGKSKEGAIDGDGTRALAIGELAKASFLLEIKKDENGKTIYEVENLEDLVEEKDGVITITSRTGGNNISGQYADIITGLGISKQQSDNIVDNQELLVHQLEARRQSEAGVSLNEEVTDMIKFQGAYQANARVIQTIADMLDTLINRTGV